LFNVGKKLEQYKEDSDKELTLTQQRVTELDARVPSCIHGDLQARIAKFENSFSSKMPPDLEEIGEELENMQEL
jgi:hypothetical protein